VSGGGKNWENRKKRFAGKRNPGKTQGCGPRKVGGKRRGAEESGGGERGVVTKQQSFNEEAVHPRKKDFTKGGVGVERGVRRGAGGSTKDFLV